MSSLFLRIPAEEITDSRSCSDIEKEIALTQRTLKLYRKIHPNPRQQEDAARKKSGVGVAVGVDTSLRFPLVADDALSDRGSDTSCRTEFTAETMVSSELLGSEDACKTELCV